MLAFDTATVAVVVVVVAVVAVAGTEIVAALAVEIVLARFGSFQRDSSTRVVLGIVPVVAIAGLA